MGFLSNVTWFKCINFRNIVANNRVAFDFLNIWIEWTSLGMLSCIFVHCIAIMIEVQHRLKLEVLFLSKLSADKRYRKKKLSLWCSLSPQTLFHTPKWSENHNLRTNNIFDQQSASAPVKPCLLECNVPLDIHAWHLVQQHLSDFWAAATGLVKENALLRGNISDRKEWLWAESKGDHPTLYGRDTVFNSH